MAEKDDLFPDDKDDFDKDLDSFGDDNLDSFNDSFDDFDGGGVAPMNKHSELLKELTNFDPIIQRRIRNWLGLEWDAKLKEYKQKKEAIINEAGAWWAIGCLETYQAKPNFITNLGREEYVSIKIEILELAWLVLPTKCDEFGIKETADQWRLSNELQHSAYLVLAGAGDGKYTKFLGETHTVHENVNVQPQQPQQTPKGNGFADTLKNALLGRKQ